MIRAVPAVRAEPEPPARPAAEPTRKPRGRRAERGPGRRELRRQETRARIVDAAAELFAERGFDAVSVMEIAKRAGVVEKTVFNHFPVKEGLVFDADPPMRAALLDAVRRRPSGESVSAAAGSFVVSAMSMLGSPEAADGVARMARIVRSSRVLQVREREILVELTDSLADLSPRRPAPAAGQVEPWLAAHAVLGLYASLLELARDRVLDGVEGHGADRGAAVPGPPGAVPAAVRAGGVRQAAVSQTAICRATPGHRPLCVEPPALPRTLRPSPAGRPPPGTLRPRGRCSCAAAGRPGRRGRRGSG